MRRRRKPLQSMQQRIVQPAIALLWLPVTQEPPCQVVHLVEAPVAVVQPVPVSKSAQNLININAGVLNAAVLQHLLIIAQARNSPMPPELNTGLTAAAISLVLCSNAWGLDPQNIKLSDGVV